MARRCFEVSRLIFKLCYLEQEKTEKGKSVLESFKKQLKKYASNTVIRDHFMFIDNGKVVMHIEFQKRIAVNTVNNILSQMFTDKHTCNTSYDGEMKRMTVTVIKWKFWKRCWDFQHLFHINIFIFLYYGLYNFKY